MSPLGLGWALAPWLPANACWVGQGSFPWLFRSRKRSTLKIWPCCIVNDVRCMSSECMCCMARRGLFRTVVCGVVGPRIPGLPVPCRVKHERRRKVACVRCTSATWCLVTDYTATVRHVATWYARSRAVGQRPCSEGDAERARASAIAVCDILLKMILTSFSRVCGLIPAQSYAL